MYCHCSPLKELIDYEGIVKGAVWVVRDQKCLEIALEYRVIKVTHLSSII